MTKEKIIELIKGRISASEEELKRQRNLYEKDKKYAVPDNSYINGRVSAFKEVIELIGMLDKKNNE